MRIRPQMMVIGLLSSGLALGGVTGILAAAPATGAPVDTVTQVVTFSPNGNQQATFTVPSDALEVGVEVVGANGSVNRLGNPVASKGAAIASNLGTSFNGQKLNLIVGGLRAGSIPTSASVGIQGGGGSYLATDDEFLAIAAGGGGGGVYTSPNVAPTSGNLVGGDGGLPSPGGTPPPLSNGLQANGTGATDTAPGTLPNLTTAPNNTATATRPQAGTGTGQGPATIVNGTITPAFGGIGAASGTGGGGGFYGGGGGVSLLGRTPAASGLIRGGGGGGSSLVGEALPSPIFGQNPGSTPTTGNGYIAFTVTMPAHPSLMAAGSVTSGPVITVGDPVTYTYTVTNDGNIDLTEIGLKFGGLTGDSPTVTCVAETLAVGAVTTCTATYTATQADVDTGGIPSTVTPSGTDTNGYPAKSDTMPAPVIVNPVRSLGVVALPPTGTGIAAGQQVTYRYQVTNTGTATAIGLSLAQAGFTGTGDTPTLSCPTGDLAPGVSVECTATYTMTQADIDSGTTLTSTVIGTATQAGNPSASNAVTAEQAVVQAPGLTVAVQPDTSIATVGQRVTYTFTVSNTGNLTLTDPAVVDVDFSGTGQLSEWSCPLVASLAPGEEIVCSATYVVTADDLPNGPLTITAAGTAHDLAGTTIAAERSEETRVLVKAAAASPAAGNSTPTPNPVDSTSKDALAATGNDVATPAGILALGLLVFGGVFLTLRWKPTT